jgi:hypothetical protein
VSEVSTFRLCPLMAMYLFIAVGLAVTRWSGQQDPGTGETLFAYLLGIVLVPIVMPCGYVLERYVRALLDGSAPGIDALTPRWQVGAQRIGYVWTTRTTGATP